MCRELYYLPVTIVVSFTKCALPLGLGLVLIVVKGLKPKEFRFIGLALMVSHLRHQDIFKIIPL